MRDVNDNSKFGGPEPGGCLHLDVSRGASGAMIAGALLDLGLDEQVARSALDAAGLTRIGVRAHQERRQGTAGTLVELTDDAGRPLMLPTPPREPRRASARPHARRRQQSPHPDRRPEPEQKAMGVAMDEPGDGEGAPPADEGQVLPLGGTVAPSEPASEPEPEPQSAVTDWLADKEVSADGVLRHLRDSDLAPISKAIALKALRRALSSRAHTLGQTLAETTLHGLLAAELVAEAVICGALLDALSPARISASVVLLDASPDPWVEAILEGTRAREVELGFSPTTPMGAALIWAVAHRFGPRGEVVLGSAGTGLGRARGRGAPFVSRALYGPDRALAARVGAPERSPLFRVEAQLAAFDPALLTALRGLGARSLATEAALGPTSVALTRLVCVVDEAALDELSAALYAHGAAEVLVSFVEVWAPERREVTVQVGRGNRKELVSLTVVRDKGRVLFVEPSQEDLQVAASRLRSSLEAVRREALDALSEQVDGPQALAQPEDDGSEER